MILRPNPAFGSWFTPIFPQVHPSQLDFVHPHGRHSKACSTKKPFSEGNGRIELSGYDSIRSSSGFSHQGSGLPAIEGGTLFRVVFNENAPGNHFFCGSHSERKKRNKEEEKKHIGVCGTKWVQRGPPFGMAKGHPWETPAGCKPLKHLFIFIAAESLIDPYRSSQRLGSFSRGLLGASWLV